MTWIKKFRHAVRGVEVAFLGERTFWVHLLISSMVIVAGIVLGMSLVSWCLLVLCILSVLVAEMFNTAIEGMSRAITQEKNPQIRDALDVSAGGVLLASIGAAIIGILLFGQALSNWLEWSW